MKLDSSSKPRLTCWSFSLLLLAWAAGCLVALGAESQPESALTPIFNGKDLAGWQVPDPNPFWKVADGVLTGENDEKLKGNVLYTKKSYGDFVLELDARWSGEIDSGIMLRSPELQLQFGVSRSLKKDLTCAFYTGGAEKYPVAGQPKGLEAALKPGDWNTYRLEARGPRFTVWVNGKKVTEYTNEKYAKPAPIGLQVHPGLAMKVEFRNLRVREL